MWAVKLRLASQTRIASTSLAVCGLARIVIPLLIALDSSGTLTAAWSNASCKVFRMKRV